MSACQTSFMKTSLSYTEQNKVQRLMNKEQYVWKLRAVKPG